MAGQIRTVVRGKYLVNILLKKEVSLQQYSRYLSTVTSQHYVCQNKQTWHNNTQIRFMSSQKKGFFSQIFSDIRQDLSKSKEIKESVDYFREQRKKLEESEALKKARKKYENIESESKGSVGDLSFKVKETFEELSKTELGQKGKNVVEDLSKTAQKTAQRTVETLSRGSEQLSKTTIYKSVSEGVKVMRDEIDEATMRGRLYQAPSKLRTREDMRVVKEEHREVKENLDATGVTLHKDSKWFQSWQNFKDNNQFVNKMFDMKTKYNESENIMIRATRTFTDKLTDMFGGVFSKTEMSEVLTEIVKMDPTFDKEKFLKDCQFEIVPNILESIMQGNMEILKDWTYEAVFNTISHPLKQAQQAGYKMDSKVLDISHMDIVAGKMMEQGPVLVISFNAQQVIVVRDSTGNVKEGDPDKIMRVFHVWAFCRDQENLDPIAAWRLIDLSSSPSEQWL